MPGTGGLSAYCAKLALANVSGIIAIAIPFVVLTVVFMLGVSGCCACSTRPRRHGLTTELSDLHPATRGIGCNPAQRARLPNYLNRSTAQRGGGSLQRAGLASCRPPPYPPDERKENGHNQTDAKHRIQKNHIPRWSALITNQNKLGMPDAIEILDEWAAKIALDDAHDRQVNSRDGKTAALLARRDDDRWRGQKIEQH